MGRIVLWAIVLFCFALPLAAQDGVPTPPQPCSAPTAGQITAYRLPDSANAGIALSPDEPIIVSAELASGWYGVVSMGALAGSTGSILFDWIEAHEGMALEGNCATLPTIYPYCVTQGDGCRLLTTMDASSYPQPDTTGESSALPGLLVQVLARSEGDWYGYDPAYSLNGAAGVRRLQWIHAPNVDQLNGDCEALPIVNPQPTMITQADHGSSIQMNVGDSLEVTLEGNPTTGYIWMQPPMAGENALLQQQGMFTFVPSSELVGAGGVFTLTFVAMAEGETTLQLGYMRRFEENPLEIVTVYVTVGAAS